MPNGNPDEPNAIGARSRFWRCVWYIGDTSYYLGLFSAVILLIAAIILPPYWPSEASISRPGGTCSSTLPSLLSSVSVAFPLASRWIEASKR